MAAPLRVPRSNRRTDPGALPFRKRRPYRSDQTVGAMLVAFLVATLLGSQSLVNLARQQPFGTKRTVLVALAESVHTVSHALWLDRPAVEVNEWTGKAPPVRVDVEAMVQQQAAAPPTTASTIPFEINPATGLRFITPSQPLRVLLAGDSMMREYGGAIEELADADLTSVTLDYRVSSGLSRPDFFDWPSRLARYLDESPPEAVVLLFGTNDHQDVEVDGEILQADSPEWLAEYHRRVALVMDLLHRPGLTVTWIALPAMRSADFSAAMQALNAVYRAEAESRPWVRVVAGDSSIAGPDGGYTALLAGEDGVDVSMRQEDGVHLSAAGADRAAVAIWDDVVQRWDLQSAAENAAAVDGG
jgi:hypothetical protein